MSRYQMVGAGIHNSWLQIADEEHSDLYNPRFHYIYQLRGKESAGQPSFWQELWPRPMFACGDADVPLAVLGQDVSDTGKFEYPSTISRGMVRPWFFRGFCRDANGNALGGAVVEAFLTATDVCVGRTTCNDAGWYECPTSCYAQNHYLVARYTSGALAGATLDTLQPVL